MIEPPEDYPLPWDQAFNGEDYVIRDAHLMRVANFIECDVAAYAVAAANALPGLVEACQQLVQEWDDFMADEGLMNPLDTDLDRRIEQVRNALPKEAAS